MHSLLMLTSPTDSHVTLGHVTSTVDSCDDVDPSSSTTSPVTLSIVLLTHRLRTRYCHVLTWVLVLVALS